MLSNFLKRLLRMIKKWIFLTLCALLILFLKILNVNDSFNRNEKVLYLDYLEELKIDNRLHENIEDEKYFQKLERDKRNYFTKAIPVVIVLCQNPDEYWDPDELKELYNNKYYMQVKVLLKSIALVTEKVNRVIIIANTVIPIQGVKKFINTWPISYQNKVLLEYHTFTPRKECMDKKYFKLCASVRLFLHEILPHEDSVIYVDSDFIFLVSPERLANHFLKFDSLQFVGATRNAGFYEVQDLFQSADYYYHGDTGISTGMLLMNLTRIRKFKNNWTETVYSVCRSYKRRMWLYDQGVYNIIFSEYLENLYELDCRWSYNAYFCRESSICNDALNNGTIFAVHGPSNTFFQYKSKKLKVLYQVFEKFKLGNSISGLVADLEFELKEIEIVQPEDTDGCKEVTSLDKALLRPLMQKI